MVRNFCRFSYEEARHRTTSAHCVCVCVICVSSWLLKMKYINYLLFSVRERDSNIKQNESASQRSSYSCAEYSGKRRMHRGIERTIRCDEHVNWRTSLSDCIHCVYNMCVRACECVCELLRVFLPFLRMHFYDITERCAHDVHGQLKRVNQNRMHARTTYVRAFAKKNHTDTHTHKRTLAIWEKYPAATALIARIRAVVLFYRRFSIYFIYFSFCYWSVRISHRPTNQNNMNETHAECILCDWIEKKL